MNAVEIFEGLGGAAALGTAVWFVANWRAKKKIEKANAESAAAEADSKVADNWQKFAEKIQGEYDELRQRFNALEQRQMRVERALSTTTTQKRYAEYHICTDLACTDRKPPIGTFKTEDFTDIIKTEIEKKNE